MKALLLAAGYGTRLRPLTDYIPKPLTLFMGRPILDIVYDQVVAAGLDQAAVNTHHLPALIQKHVESLAKGELPIHISHEQTILGTGGSINPLRDWLGGDDLLIFNGDIVSSVDLKEFITAYRSSGAKAAMVLIPHKPGTTPVYRRDDRVLEIGNHPSAAEAQTFAGIHIISNAFIEQMPREGFFSVIDTYQRLLKAGEPILAFLHEGFWADLGIPRDYLEAHREFWSLKDREALATRLQLDDSAWDFDADQGSLFIGCRRIAGARNSFVFGPLGPADQPIHLDQCIVYPNTDLNKHRQTQGKIITSYACLDIM